MEAAHANIPTTVCGWKGTGRMSWSIKTSKFENRSARIQAFGFSVPLLGSCLNSITHLKDFTILGFTSAFCFQTRAMYIYKYLLEALTKIIAHTYIHKQITR